ncbi:hypothetical protein [Marinibacterium sp. SX1]|uniref:hypothetical protein n=1 Tax=Marinibacterium sp. SX1 TaxID=3388424 RepID=UPI003D1700A7
MTIVLAAPLALAGCETVKGVFDGSDSDAVPTVATEPDMPVLKPAPTEEVPVALPVSGTATLGTTVASLGDPGRPGLWMDTPLTRAEQTGQVQYQGSTVTLTLRPTGGEPGSGSRMSVLAMQAIGAPLTELVEVTVIGAR